VQLLNNVLPYLVHSPGIKEKLFQTNVPFFFLYSKSGAKCVSCAYKASSGLLYPLERGFIYITKPPIYITHDEVASCGFNRSNTATGRTFDFEIKLKSGGSQVFSNIEK
jgi:C4-type Zn-finger protein